MALLGVIDQTQQFYNLLLLLHSSGVTAVSVNLCIQFVCHTSKDRTWDGLFLINCLAQQILNCHFCAQTKLHPLHTVYREYYVSVRNIFWLFFARGVQFFKELLKWCYRHINVLFNHLHQEGYTLSDHFIWYFNLLIKSNLSIMLQQLNV